MKLDIFVVAYHAKEDLAEAVSSIAKFSQHGYRLVVYENSAKNYPLTWLWNEFMRQSRREFVAFCNPDIVVAQGWDSESLECFEVHQDVAAVSPASNYPPHEALAALGVRFHFGEDPELVPYHCALVRRAAWEKVGGFDDKIPFAGNDYKLNERFVAEGMRLGVAVQAKIWHKWNSSVKEAKKRGEYDEKWCVPNFSEPPKEMT